MVLRSPSRKAPARSRRSASTTCPRPSVVWRRTLRASSTATQRSATCSGAASSTCASASPLQSSSRRTRSSGARCSSCTSSRAVILKPECGRRRVLVSFLAAHLRLRCTRAHGGVTHRTRRKGKRTRIDGHEPFAGRLALACLLAQQVRRHALRHHRARLRQDGKSHTRATLHEWR